MNSKFTTAVLTILAIPLAFLASVQLRNKDLTSLFGAPPRPSGKPLYGFFPQHAARIHLTNNAGERASFEKKSGVWVMREPYADRADFSLLQTIAFSAASMRVESSLLENEVPPEDLGLTAGSYTVEVIGGDGSRLAHYQIGRRSAWYHLDTENEQLMESVFVKPLDLDDRHLYVCSGVNIRRILDQGFGSLRDRHPFLFSKPHISGIDIKKNGTLIRLARETPTSPWLITKPLNNRHTDPEVVTQLIDDLYKLQATKVSNPESITPPPGDVGEAWLTITVREFDPYGNPSDRAATLRVEAPVSEEATNTLATVDNRAGHAVFEMPLSSSEDSINLSQLPLEINELRSKTLLNREFRNCESLVIDARPLTFPLSFQRDFDQRTNRYRWRFIRHDSPEPANERTMGKLRTALELSKIVDFTSDAISDLEKFGLADPEKSVVLRFGPEDIVHFLFGRSKDHKYYATRKGSSTVVEIDAGTYTGIPTTGHEWRDSLLWNFSIVDLEAITIRRLNRPPLIITYDDLLESWSARSEGKDVTALLNLARARKFIDFLETLEVERWLGADASYAEKALNTPDYSLDIRIRQINDDGEQTGVITRTLDIARASKARTNQTYYGRLSNEPEFFRFDREAARQFASELLEQE